MAQFDVFEFAGGDWAVDVQSELIGVADTIVVAPLLRPDEHLKPLSRLNPLVPIAGERRVLMAQLLTAVRRPPASRRVGNLAAHEYEIKAALDLLVGGV